MVQRPCRTGIREQAHPRTGKTEPRQAEADRDVHVCGETPDRLFRRAAEQKPRFGGHDQRFFRCGRDELRLDSCFPFMSVINLPAFVV